MSTKARNELYLSQEVAVALGEYTRRHRARFRTTSQAANHLLRRALMDALDEGTEAIMAPLIRQVVRDATRQEIEDGLAVRLAAQTERLAGLLVRSGKDAAGTFEIATAILERVLGDPVRAREIAADARLRAGAQYARGAAKPPGGAVRP